MFTEFTLDAVMNHFCPFHPFTPSFFKIYCSVITTISNGCKFSDQNSLHIFHIFHVCYMSYPSLFNFPSSMQWRIRIIRLMYSILHSVNFHSFRSKCCSQHFIFKLHKSIYECFWWWYITVNMAVIFGHSHCLGFFQASNPIS